MVIFFMIGFFKVVAKVKQNKYLIDVARKILFGCKCIKPVSFETTTTFCEIHLALSRKQYYPCQSLYSYLHRHLHNSIHRTQRLLI